MPDFNDPDWWHTPPTRYVCIVCGGHHPCRHHPGADAIRADRWTPNTAETPEGAPSIPADHPRLPDADETRRLLAQEPVCPGCSDGLPTGHGPWGDDLCETCAAGLADDLAAEKEKVHPTKEGDE